MLAFLHVCRGQEQPAEPFMSAKLGNKLPNGVSHQTNEGGNTSMPEFRRSLSIPREKVFGTLKIHSTQK